MKVPFVFFLLLYIPLAIQSQELRSYTLYTSDGDQITFGNLVDEVSGADVVLFGEQHNNPICHWLELELTKALSQLRDVTLGAEMFEQDDQLALNEYLNGTLSEGNLEHEVKLWPNYNTDYAPLVLFAKEQQVPFIATNVPKRYASMVARNGQDVLGDRDKEAKQYLPKLPYDVRKEDLGYEEMRQMMGGHAHGDASGIENLVAAQALKDLTMAENILKHRKKKGLFLHFNGAFHSKLFSGIVGYLVEEDKKLKVLTITTLNEFNDTFQEEWKEQGDFILVIHPTMTKTY